MAFLKEDEGSLPDESSTVLPQIMRSVKAQHPITDRTEHGHLTPGYQYIVNKPLSKMIKGESTYYN